MYQLLSHITKPEPKKQPRTKPTHGRKQKIQEVSESLICDRSDSRISGQRMEYLANGVGETGLYLDKNKLTLLYVCVSLVNFG